MGQACGNATEACRIAGYRGNAVTLGACGKQNLKKSLIREEIEKRAKADPVVATREDRQRWWTKVMLDEKEDMADRLRASELLGKTQADFVSRFVGGFSVSTDDVDDLTDKELMAIARKGK